MSLLTFLKSPAASSVTLSAQPATPLAFYSTKRLSGWAGNCLRIVNLSTSAETDIGFGADGYLDMAAVAAAVGANTACGVRKLYDQSGNGYDATNAGANGKLWVLHPDTARRGRQGILCTESTTNDPFTIPSGVAGNRNAFSVLDVSAMHTLGTNTIGFWGMTNAGADAVSLLMNESVNHHALGYRQTTTVRSSTTLNPHSQIQFHGLVGGASDTVLYCDDLSDALATSGTGTFAGGSIGKTGSTGTFGGNYFHWACYARALTPSEVAAARAELVSAFRAHAGLDTRIIFEGDSLCAGQGATRKVNVHVQLEPLLSRPVYMYNKGVGGRLFSAMLTNYAADVATRYRAGMTNILHVTAGINDIVAGTAGADLFEDTATAYVQNGFATGYDVIFLSTLIPRNSNTAGQETQRLAYNALVTDPANVATYGYRVCDYAALPEMASPTNLTYYDADGTHLKTAGYLAQATYLAGLINPLL